MTKQEIIAKIKEVLCYRLNTIADRVEAISNLDNQTLRVEIANKEKELLITINDKINKILRGHISRSLTEYLKEELEELEELKNGDTPDPTDPEDNDIVGLIKKFDEVEDQTDWMPLDGKSLDKLEYPELYSVIGDQFDTSNINTIKPWSHQEVFNPSTDPLGVPGSYVPNFEGFTKYTSYAGVVTIGDRAYGFSVGNNLGGDSVHVRVTSLAESNYLEIINEQFLGNTFTSIDAVKVLTDTDIMLKGYLYGGVKYNIIRISGDTITVLPLEGYYPSYTSQNDYSGYVEGFGSVYINNFWDGLNIYQYDPDELTLELYKSIQYSDLKDTYVGTRSVHNGYVYNIYMGSDNMEISRVPLIDIINDDFTMETIHVGGGIVDRSYTMYVVFASDSFIYLKEDYGLGIYELDLPNLTIELISEIGSDYGENWWIIEKDEELLIKSYISDVKVFSKEESGKLIIGDNSMFTGYKETPEGYLEYNIESQTTTVASFIFDGRIWKFEITPEEDSPVIELHGFKITPNDGIDVNDVKIVSGFDINNFGYYIMDVWIRKDRLYVLTLSELDNLTVPTVVSYVINEDGLTSQLSNINYLLDESSLLFNVASNDEYLYAVFNIDGDEEENGELVEKTFKYEEDGSITPLKEVSRTINEVKAYGGVCTYKDKFISISPYAFSVLNGNTSTIKQEISILEVLSNGDVRVVSTKEIASFDAYTGIVGGDNPISLIIGLTTYEGGLLAININEVMISLYDREVNFITKYSINEEDWSITEEGVVRDVNGDIFVLPHIEASLLESIGMTGAFNLCVSKDHMYYITDNIRALPYEGILSDYDSIINLTKPTENEFSLPIQPGNIIKVK